MKTLNYSFHCLKVSYILKTILLLVTNIVGGFYVYIYVINNSIFHCFLATTHGTRCTYLPEGTPRRMDEGGHHLGILQQSTNKVLCLTDS